MKCRSALLLCALAFCRCIVAFPGEFDFSFLPKGRPFHLCVADPREVKMGLSIDGENKITGIIGNYLGFFEMTPKDSNENWRLDLGGEGAGYFLMGRSGTRFPLETTDGLLGLYLEGNYENYQAQLRYTHISAHRSDGASGNLAVGTPIIYSREFIQGRAGYLITPNLQIYGGVQFLVNTIPKVSPWMVQGGGSFFLVDLIRNIAPYVALDLNCKGESSYNPSLSLQLGMAIYNHIDAFHSIRVFYSYYTGSDYRGQLIGHSLTLHSVGVEMQI